MESYRHLELSGGIQWPYPSGAGEQESALPPAECERRLFAENHFFTPDHKARFVFEMPRTAPELPDRDYPFTLMTGRGSSAQWHTGTRTNKSEVLRSLAPRQLYVELNPTDARHLGIKQGQPAKVVTRRGSATAISVLTTTVQPGQIFLPMHFEDTNELTLGVVDPYSRQPAYKHCAARVEKA
jgi:assimilatory nitrate reductase catalytic subunit